MARLFTRFAQRATCSKTASIATAVAQLLLSPTKTADGYAATFAIGMQLT